MKYRLITLIYDVVMFYISIPFFIAFVYIFDAKSMQNERAVGFLLIQILNPVPNILVQYLFLLIVDIFTMRISEAMKQCSPLCQS